MACGSPAADDSRASPLNMRRKLAVTAVLCSGLLVACATTSGSPAPLRIAITIDDLPVHGPVPTGQTSAEISDRLIATLTQAKVPAMIFVNGQWTESEPATSQILVRWDEAGFQLANHGWSHRHLNEMELPEFERELVRNDELLRRYGGNWHWFRYPFLDEGETAEKRSAARRLLAGHGYHVASVTMDFSDWAWTAPYARCLAKGDKAAIQSLEDAYLKAARESADFSRTLSRDVHGRDIPLRPAVAWRGHDQPHDASPVGDIPGAGLQLPAAGRGTIGRRLSGRDGPEPATTQPGTGRPCP